MFHKFKIESGTARESGGVEEELHAIAVFSQRQFRQTFSVHSERIGLHCGGIPISERHVENPGLNEERQIAELQRMLSLLEYKCWYYETACQAGTEDAVRNLRPCDIPPEWRAILEKMNLHSE